jgi:hypothetical protein
LPAYFPQAVKFILLAAAPDCDNCYPYVNT